MTAADVFDSPALPLLLRLEAEGCEVQAAEPDRLRIRPVERVTPELRAELRQHKAALLTLVRVCDAGVQDRRAVFARQLADAPAGTVAFIYKPDVPYARGVCFSCGDGPLGRHRAG